MTKILPAVACTLTLFSMTYSQNLTSAPSSFQTLMNTPDAIARPALQQELKLVGAAKEKELQQLLTLLKPQNPDVIAKRAEIEAINLVRVKIEAGEIQADNHEGLALELFKSEVLLDEMKTLLKSTNPDVVAKQQEVNSLRVVLRMIVKSA